MRTNTGWLRRCALFAELREGEIDFLGRRARKARVGAGHVLLREGEAGRSLFIILSGSVRIVKKTPEGREQTIALLRAGDVLGEMSLLDDKPRSATAVTNGAASLIQLSREDLEALAEVSPGSQQRLMANGMRLALERLRGANEQFLELARVGAKVRSQLGQMRSQILTLVSHEFRTPLTVIKSSAQLLRRSGPTGSGRGFLEKIERQSAKLQQLVDDLITVSSLRARPWIEEAREVDVARLLEKTLDELRPQAEEQGVVLRLGPQAGGCRVQGDPALVGRALHHLAASVLELASSGAEVSLAAEPVKAGGVRVEVKGCGPGLEAHSACRLNTPFAGDTADTGDNGLGIGWTLVRQVAAAHGGGIQVEAGEKQELCLTLKLPPEPEAQLCAGAGVGMSW